MSQYTDEWFLESLRSPDERLRDEALKAMYFHFYPKMEDYILRNSGTKVDAADVFQDAIVVFFTKLVKHDLQLNCSIYTYLRSICRNRWLSDLRLQKRTTELEPASQEQPSDEDVLQTLLKDEQEKMVAKVLGQMGEDCRKVLIFYYFDKLRMKKIAELMRYSNEQVARNKKSTCLRRLRELILRSDELTNELK
ncbi:MAG: sigma-70 family RNA polymerase sigma factor [Bacteroidota bacterium]